MYYEIHGDGPPLLLLHGGTGSIESFPAKYPYFATQFRVIAMEQMGHGRTADIDRDYIVRGDQAIAYGLVDHVIERRQLPSPTRAIVAA